MKPQTEDIVQQSFELTNSQRENFNLIESSDENFMLLGAPGVGKSVLIRALVEEGLKDYVLCAPTGLAAINIGGRTLHSMFQIPSSGGWIAPDYDHYKLNEDLTNYIRYKVKHLIIDEISMVRADCFDYVDRLLRQVKGLDKSFGGVQLICIGDFFQLPPVIRAEEKKQMIEYGYDSPFVFSARAFQGFKILKLTEILRQKGDKKFVNLLWNARQENIKPKDLVLLNQLVNPIEASDLRIRLCPTNKEADDINYGFLRSISGDATKYKASVYGKWPAYPCEEMLNLKVGAQVMVKKNRSDVPSVRSGQPPVVSKVVNGTLGVVKEMAEDSVTITLRNGEEAKIYKRLWERKIKEKVDGVWEEKTLASFEQIPLQLAWAISIHKSQGQTFEQCHIAPKKIFAAGQLYVALSRCRSLDGLSLETRCEARHFWADEKVLEFEKSIL